MPYWNEVVNEKCVKAARAVGNPPEVQCLTQKVPPLLRRPSKLPRFFVRFILKGGGRASGTCVRELNVAAREQAERNGI